MSKEKTEEIKSLEELKLMTKTEFVDHYETLILECRYLVPDYYEQVKLGFIYGQNSNKS